jgi:branched-chain amino acid transport system ATP-binding protein
MSTSSSAGLSIRDLQAGYGGVPAVRGVSFDVAPGEVVALLGPNGAGKTTTLMSVMGVNPPMAGSVSFEGQDVTGKAPDALSRLGLSLVPDSRGIFFDLTVKQHLRLAVVKGDKTTLDAVLDRLPALRGLMDRKAGVLSGGEQQMLALAKAFVARPKVLMVDEMSLGLAPLIVQSLMPIIRRAATEDGMAVLLVEQHIEMALEVADRGVVMNRGAVLFEGPTSELLANREQLEASYLSRA